MKDIIIAIDGHSSCGKSTLAKHLASYFHYRYIDTGAMYRTVALYFMRKDLVAEDLNEGELKQGLAEIEIDFKYDAINKRHITLMNGEDVEEEIRGIEVTREVSKYSQKSLVRKKLVDQQQVMGKEKRIVMDGRDIGTRVFPQAELKLFVTADLDVRAERRHAEMLSKGLDVSLEDVKKNLAERDYNDTHKGESPLKKAEDAIVMDNTYLSIEDGFKMAEKLVMERIGD